MSALVHLNRPGFIQMVAKAPPDFCAEWNFVRCIAEYYTFWSISRHPLEFAMLNHKHYETHSTLIGLIAESQEEHLFLEPLLVHTEYPFDLSTPDRKGLYPFDKYLFNAESIDFKLIDAFSELKASLSSPSNWDLERFLLSEKNHIRLLKKLIKSDPRFLTKDKTYIYTSMASDKIPECIDEIIAGNPDALLNRHGDYFSVLHLLYKVMVHQMAFKEDTKATKATIEAIKKIINSCPSVVLAVDEKEMNILHCVALEEYYPSPEITELLIRKYPELLKQKTASGFEPAHLFAIKNNYDALHVILDVDPDALLRLNHQGENFLHMLIGRPASEASDLIVERLLEKRPDAAKFLPSKV